VHQEAVQVEEYTPPSPSNENYLRVLIKDYLNEHQEALQVEYGPQEAVQVEQQQKGPDEIHPPPPQMKTI